jgi:hypothetical protein
MGRRHAAALRPERWSSKALSGSAVPVWQELPEAAWRRRPARPRDEGRAVASVRRGLPARLVGSPRQVASAAECAQAARRPEGQGAACALAVSQVKVMAPACVQAVLR